MKEITSTQHIDALPNLEETPEAYIIYNEGNKMNTIYWKSSAFQMV